MTPFHYSLPDHLSRLTSSPEFKAAAAKVEKELDAFKDSLTKELKSVTAEVRAQELKDFEAALGEKALFNALEKFRDDLRLELKKAVAKVRADELAHFERDVGKRALAAAAKR